MEIVGGAEARGKRFLKGASVSKVANEARGSSHPSEEGL